MLPVILDPEGVLCGIVTGRLKGAGHQRCTRTSSDHRGPHWAHAEPIKCDCKYFCGVPDHLDLEALQNTTSDEGVRR